MPTLKLDLRVGETLRLSGQGSAAITLTAKSGQLARLSIERDESLQVQLPASRMAMDAVMTGLKSQYRGAA